MSETAKATADLFTERFGDHVSVGDTQSGITTLEIKVDAWLEVCRALRDEDDFSFEQLTDLCGVDYLSYGMSEWDTEDASQEGFGRGVEALGPGRFDWASRPEAGEVSRRSRSSILNSVIHAPGKSPPTVASMLSRMRSKVTPPPTIAS